MNRFGQSVNAAPAPATLYERMTISVERLLTMANRLETAAGKLYGEIPDDASAAKSIGLAPPPASLSSGLHDLAAAADAIEKATCRIEGGL